MSVTHSMTRRPPLAARAALGWRALRTIPILLLLLTGCGGEGQGPPYLSPAEATEEYFAEADTLTLAPSHAWPEQPISEKAPDKAGMVYEPGFGKQAADHYWYCSWASTAIGEAADAAERAKALDEVEKIRTTYYYTTALAAESKPSFDKILSNARLGDLSALEADVRLNCPPLRASSP